MKNMRKSNFIISPCKGESKNIWNHHLAAHLLLTIRTTQSQTSNFDCDFDVSATSVPSDLRRLENRTAVFPPDLLTGKTAEMFNQFFSNLVP